MNAPGLGIVGLVVGGAPSRRAVVGEPIIESEPEGLQGRVNRGRGTGCRVERRRRVVLAPEIRIQILDPARPPVPDGELHAGSGRPAEMHEGLAGAVLGGDVEAMDAPGKAAGDVRQEPAEGITKAAPDGAEIAQPRLERDAGPARHFLAEPNGEIVGEGHVRLGAQHDIVGKLVIIARLQPAEESRRLHRGEDERFAWNRTGRYPHRPDIVAEMSAQIGAAPIIARRRGWRLEGHRQVGRQGGAAQGQIDQKCARRGGLDAGSAVAEGHDPGAFRKIDQARRHRNLPMSGRVSMTSICR